jgi:hypothetical protein
MKQRPQNFKINWRHRLACGLVFAGLGSQSTKTLRYTDSSPFHNHGVLTSMTLSTDCVWANDIGQLALRFDGTSGSVIVPDAPQLKIIGNKTLCCWINLGIDSSGCGFAGKSDSTVKGLAIGYGWNTNGFMALCWNSSNAPYIAKDAARDVGKWCYAASVQSGSTRYIYVFDRVGLRTSSYSLGGTHTWNNTVPLMIGNAGSTKAPANTKIAAVQAYNRALSLSELSQLADPTNVLLSGLILYPSRRFFTVKYSTSSQFLLFKQNNKHLVFKTK